MTIGDEPVGEGAPTFIIAEAGINHNGDPELARRLVDVSADAGADAVKFQTFDPDLLAAGSAAAAGYQAARTGASTQRELLAGLTLPRGAWRELAEQAHGRGLAFLSTPFDADSLELVVSLGVGAVKVASGEVTNLPFLHEVASVGLPVVLSTGMATFDEVDAAVAAVEGAQTLCLLHCVTAYPAPEDEANLRAIPAMAERYGVPVGWSDHTTGSVTAVAAVALGAAVLEKHVTTDRGLPGPDHAASLEPDGLRDYVTSVRTARRSLGDGMKRPTDSERANLEVARRSWHAARDLTAGTRLDVDDLLALRPATGIPPDVDLVGRMLVVDVPAGDPITRACLKSVP